jgi:ankyrin repeat protein
MLFTKYPSQSFKWLFAEGGTNPPVHAAVSAKNVAFLRLLFDFAFDAPVDDDPSSTPGRPRYVQRSRNFARVKRLILTSDNDGWTPLHIAASNDSPECLQALLYQMGPLGPASLAPDIDVPLEPTRETPLHRAASGEQLECAKLLLSRGASVLVQDHNGASAAHWAAWGGDAEILGLIMDMCIRETGSSRFTVHQSLRNDWGALPLHYAAGEGETNCARRLVECYGAYAMEQNNEGDTPVHIAARKGHTETLKFLLSSLPDLQGYLDVARQSGHTPLMDAALDDKPECVALLLKHGASPLVEKRVGPPGELPGMTAAHFAAANSVSSLKIILSHTPLERFDRPRKSTQTTLLATACDNGQEDCVTLLLERGVTPLRAFPRNGVACSALSVAAVSNRGSLVRLLCQASARERPDDWIEWFNQNLHFDVVLLTAGNGKTEALEALMDFGFDMRTARKLSGAMNMKPMTPFAIASQEKKQNVLDLLKKHGITS